MPYKRKNFSQKILHEYLDYNPEDGEFRWKKRSFGSHVKIGDVAGGVHVHNDGYKVIRFLRQNYVVHRLVWYYVHGYFPKEDIDHINRVRTDNRLCNLRLANKSQQAHHAGRKNKTGYKGVGYSPTKQRFKARILHNGKLYYLGCRFKTAEEAALAYQQAAAKLFGDFACSSVIPNPVEEVEDMPNISRAP